MKIGDRPTLLIINAITIWRNALNVKDVIRLENCKLAYKVNRELLPIKIKDCIKTDNFGRNLEKNHKYATRNKNVQNLPIAKTKLYKNSVFVECICEYSLVSSETRSLEKFPKFVNNLKTKLFATYL